nr:hypothetical protein [Muribaculaceae bacterium]
RTAPDGTLAFSAAINSPVNAAFASLRNVDGDRLKGATPQPRAAKVDQTAAPSCVTEETPRIPAARVSRWRKLRNGAAGIAASLAVLVTISLFALNPIRMANEPNKASIAPIPADNAMQVAGCGEETRKTRRLTIGLPAEEGFVRLNPSDLAAKENHRKAYAAQQAAEQKAAADRLSNADKFCVIVASFPTMSQARAFMASKGGDLSVLEKDGKCRVYAATAPTYEAANALRNTCGVPDAWVCRR